MTRQEIKKQLSPLFYEFAFPLNIEAVDNDNTIWEWQFVAEPDIYELIDAINEYFDINLWEKNQINIYTITINDLITLIEREVNN